MATRALVQFVLSLANLLLYQRIFEENQGILEKNQSRVASKMRFKSQPTQKEISKMPWFRYAQTKLAPALALVVIIILAASFSNAQSNPPTSTFRSGQTMYIVAFRLIQTQTLLDGRQVDRQSDYVNYDLDAERKVRKRIEEWQFFKVAEKPSEADFIFLVNLDESSIEGLAIPFDAYRQHFKEKFDLDALRDAAFGRFVIGPLKLPTLSRLSDRLVKQFREKLAKPTK